MFGLRSAGHFFALLAHDFRVGAKFLVAHEAQIDKVLETGAAIASVVDPAIAPLAITIERAAEAALGEVLAAVAKISEAEAQHGANVALDVAAVQAFKDLLKQIEHLKPGATVIPAGLPATVK